MQAILLTGTGAPDVLVAGDVPAPTPGPGEILLRTEAIPVLFPETMLRSGAFPLPVEFPIVFGTQAAGVIIAVGAGVDAALIGQRVLVGSNTFGTYAEKVVVPADIATRIPDAVSSVDAAAVGMSGSVALRLLEAAKLTGTETILVEAAATGIGAYLTQLAKEYGAARVIATAGGPEKAEQARGFGADTVIDHLDPEWPQRLRESLDGATLDVVFDSIGGESALALLDLMTPLRGRMLGYGFLSGAAAQVTTMDLIMRGLTFVGCSGPDWLAGVAAARGEALERVAAGSISPLVDRVLPLDQAAHAHQLLADRAAKGTIVLQPVISHS
ncbi:quinone oxidoreductase family protein [Nocardia sp. CDC160]|uniref:quinone oxidoreductase family protein n=1 Tax=Nocardia sp. CDC160 TaxID=3112166 RepID=UPI002DBCA913|nr:zinc-binding dehydrogenase [Nocardia sp. CDC160]MEC3918166.1 zinc-binding dehydrogenase [Nocardia sp. CDC160]